HSPQPVSPSSVVRRTRICRPAPAVHGDGGVPSRSGPASGIASTPVIFTRGLRAPSASSECRRDLAEEALELALLVPGGEAERHVADTRVEVRAELGDTLPGAPGDGPLLDELSCELRGVVGVEECLRLLEGPRAVLVDVDVVVERAPELRGVAPLLPRHRSAPASAALPSLGPPMQTTSQPRPFDSTSRLAHCWAKSTGWRWTNVARHPTPSLSPPVTPARAERSVTDSRRGLARRLSPTQTASKTPARSASTVRSRSARALIAPRTTARFARISPK